MDDLCIGMDYRYPGHLNVITADVNDFEIGEEKQNDNGDEKLFNRHYLGKDPDRFLCHRRLAGLLPGRHGRIADCFARADGSQLHQRNIDGPLIAE